MPKIIKSGRAIRTDDVVIIPETDPAIAALQDTDDIDGIAEDEQSDNENTEVQTPADEVDKAEQLMQLAHEERDQLIAQAKQEADRIREQARQEGYQTGRQEISGRVEAALKETRELLDELAKRQHAYFTDYHKELKFLSLDIAGKIMGNAINRDDMAMADLVKQAVAMVKGSEWITIELSDRLTELISTLTQEFTVQYAARHMEIVGVNMADDACIIKTNEGVIDASVPAQIENLRSLFRDMDASGS